MCSQCRRRGGSTFRAGGDIAVASGSMSSRGGSKEAGWLKKFAGRPASQGEATRIPRRSVANMQRSDPLFLRPPNCKSIDEFISAGCRGQPEAGRDWVDDGLQNVWLHFYAKRRHCRPKRLNVVARWLKKSKVAQKIRRETRIPRRSNSHSKTKRRKYAEERPAFPPSPKLQERR